MIDSHCHLDDSRLASDLAAVLARARAAGIEEIVLAGVDPPGWVAQRNLARSTPGLYYSCGLHPWTVAATPDNALPRMLKLLAETLDEADEPRPVALGEIGLDRSRPHTADRLRQQETAFRAQLQLAIERDLPVILHILRCHERALEILREEGIPRAGGVVHSYSGSADLVPLYVELGLAISFAGPVTYPNARKPIEAARRVPLDRLLVETDAPDQTPDARKPAPNEPSFLPDILAALARARQEEPAAVAEATSANARRLFGLSITKPKLQSSET